MEAQEAREIQWKPGATILYPRAVLGFDYTDVPLLLLSSVSLIVTMEGLGVAANVIAAAEISYTVISWCYRYSRDVRILR
jgi:hypothetical protein